MSELLGFLNSHRMYVALSYFAIGVCIARVLLWVYGKYVYDPNGVRRHWLGWLWPLTMHENKPQSYADDVFSPTLYEYGRPYSDRIYRTYIFSTSMGGRSSRLYFTTYQRKGVTTPAGYIWSVAPFWPLRLAWVVVVWVVLILLWTLKKVFAPQVTASQSNCDKKPSR